MNPQHLRSRSGQHMQSFRFPRPPPSIPAPTPERPRAAPTATPRFVFDRRTPEAAPARGWLAGGMRKRRTALLWCLLFGAMVLWITRGGEEEGGKRVESPRIERVVQGTKAVKGGVVWANVGDSKEAVTEELPPAVVHWRSSEHQLSDAAPWVLSAPASRLPKCGKLLLFTFKPWWGFGSEYILYLRAASLASKLGYTLIEDDSKWNYGRLSNYFLPRTLSCVPPASWANPKKSYPLGAPGWESHPRIRYSRSILSALDDWTRETYLGNGTAPGMAELRSSMQGGAGKDMLEEGGSLPKVFEEVYSDVAREASALWRLEEGLEDEVARLRGFMGMADVKWEVKREGQVKGARKAWNKLRERATPGGRGPIIGVHIRGGDKAPEYAHDLEEMGISNTFGNMSTYVKAADDAYRRLLPDSATPLSSTPFAYSPRAEPTLLVMTAEPEVFTSIAAEPLAAPYRILSTPPPSLASSSEKASADEIKNARKEFGDRKPVAYGRKGREEDGAQRREKRELGLSAGYDQATFNLLPLRERVTHTRAFVRDLTLLAKHADAFVVSASSNIGRLAMLLGGSDATIGPRSSSGTSLGGRIRSIDAFWYPTAYVRASWEKVLDVPDTKNKATVPKDQKARAQVDRGLAKEPKWKKVS